MELDSRYGITHKQPCAKTAPSERVSYASGMEKKDDSNEMK